MDLGNYFNNVDFWDLVKNLNIDKYDSDGKQKDAFMYDHDYWDAMGYIVDESLKFYLVFKDEPNIKEMLSEYVFQIIPIVEQLHQMEIYKKCDALILKYLYYKYNVKDHNNPTEAELRMCFDQLFKNVIEPEYMFHSFNFSAYASIKQNGISPNMKLTSQDEIDTINNIFIKNGIRTPFGFQRINCINKVSYSLGPNVSYSYGTRSPEWFSYFCHYGYSYAFENRDYNQALANVNLKIANFPDEDKKLVIDFFNKNWRIYTDYQNIPIVAIIPSDSDVDYEKEYKVFKNDPLFFFEYLVLSRHYCDRQTDYIDTSNAMYVALPSYVRLMWLSNTKYQSKQRQ